MQTITVTAWHPYPQFRWRYKLASSGGWLDIETYPPYASGGSGQGENSITFDDPQAGDEATIHCIVGNPAATVADMQNDDGTPRTRVSDNVSVTVNNLAWTVNLDPAEFRKTVEAQPVANFGWTAGKPADATVAWADPQRVIADLNTEIDNPDTLTAVFSNASTGTLSGSEWTAPVHGVPGDVVTTIDLDSDPSTGAQTSREFTTTVTGKIPVVSILDPGPLQEGSTEPIIAQVTSESTDELEGAPVWWTDNTGDMTTTPVTGTPGALAYSMAPPAGGWSFDDNNFTIRATYTAYEENSVTYTAFAEHTMDITEAPPGPSYLEYLHDFSAETLTPYVHTRGSNASTFTDSSVMRLFTGDQPGWVTSQGLQAEGASSSKARYWNFDSWSSTNGTSTPIAGPDGVGDAIAYRQTGVTSGDVKRIMNTGDHTPTMLFKFMMKKPAVAHGILSRMRFSTPNIRADFDQDIPAWSTIATGAPNVLGQGVRALNDDWYEFWMVVSTLTEDPLAAATVYILPNEHNPSAGDGKGIDLAAVSLQPLTAHDPAIPATTKSHESAIVFEDEATSDRNQTYINLPISAVPTVGFGTTLQNDFAAQIEVTSHYNLSDMEPDTLIAVIGDGSTAHTGWCSVYRGTNSTDVVLNVNGTLVTVVATDTNVLDIRIAVRNDGIRLVVNDDTPSDGAHTTGLPSPADTFEVCGITDTVLGSHKRFSGTINRTRLADGYVTDGELGGWDRFGSPGGGGDFIYVATDGDNGNDGSYGSPLKYLNVAYDRAIAEGKSGIRIRGGTYYDYTQGDYFGCAYTATEQLPCVFEAEPGEEVIFDASPPEFYTPGSNPWEVHDAGRDIYKTKVVPTFNYGDYSLRGLVLGNDGDDRWVQLLSYGTYEQLASDSDLMTDDNTAYNGPGFYRDTGGTEGDAGLIYIRLVAVSADTLFNPTPSLDYISDVNPNNNVISLASAQYFSVLQASTEWVTYRNLTLRNYFTGIRLFGGYDVTLDNITFIGSKQQVICVTAACERLKVTNCTFNGAFPPWVPWYNIKSGNEIHQGMKPGGINIGGGSTEVNSLLDATIDGNTFINLFDGLTMVGGYTNGVKVINNFFHTADDACQTGLFNSNFEFAHNTIHGAGPSHNGTDQAEFPGTKYIHHNIIDGPKNLLLVGKKSNLYGAGIDEKYKGWYSNLSIPAHTGGSFSDPWNLYNNTMICGVTHTSSGNGSNQNGGDDGWSIKHEVKNNIMISVNTDPENIASLENEWIIRAMVTDFSNCDGNQYYREAGEGNDGSVVHLIRESGAAGATTHYNTFAEAQAGMPTWEVNGEYGDPGLDPTTYKPSNTTAGVDLSGTGWPEAANYKGAVDPA